MLKKKMVMSFQYVILSTLLATSCCLLPSSDSTIRITLLQLNDVYEITPVANGKEGGLARVATLRQQLLAQNPNTYTILAGDMFSPSALGTAKVNGKRLAGKQMVAVLNAMKLDYATFGNHEFDIHENEFKQRLEESRFTWISSNVFDSKGQSFPGVYKNLITTCKNGDSLKLGFFGLTLNSNKQNYVSYTNPIKMAKQQVNELQKKADVIIAITHQNVDDDMKLAQAVPEIDLIIGGHEHENMQFWRGANLTPITKADANAHSVYIHQLEFNTETRQLKIDSQIKFITDTMSEDSTVKKVVAEWVEKGFNGFRQSGFQPERVVANINEPLDGLATSVRNNPDTLTKLIAQGMLSAVPEAELAIFNSGSIRIDDVLQAGKITEYDVIRVLPFGGKILLVEMEGSLLRKVLIQGEKNKGSGGYLQTANVSNNGESWQVNGKPLSLNKKYKIAINDFLLTGLEAGLDYLNRKNPALKVMKETIDIRKALIAQLQQTFKGDE